MCRIVFLLLRSRKNSLYFGNNGRLCRCESSVQPYAIVGKLCRELFESKNIGGLFHSWTKKEADETTGPLPSDVKGGQGPKGSCSADQVSLALYGESQTQSSDSLEE